MRHNPLDNLGSVHVKALQVTCKHQCTSHTQTQQRFASARHDRNTAKAFTCLAVRQATWTNDAPRWNRGALRAPSTLKTPAGRRMTAVWTGYSGRVHICSAICACSPLPPPVNAVAWGRAEGGESNIKSWQRRSVVIPTVCELGLA